MVKVGILVHIPNNIVNKLLIPRDKRNINLPLNLSTPYPAKHFPKK